MNVSVQQRYDVGNYCYFSFWIWIVRIKCIGYFIRLPFVSATKDSDNNRADLFASVSRTCLWRFKEGNFRFSADVIMWLLRSIRDYIFQGITIHRNYTFHDKTLVSFFFSSPRRWQRHRLKERTASIKWQSVKKQSKRYDKSLIFVSFRRVPSERIKREDRDFLTQTREICICRIWYFLSIPPYTSLTILQAKGPSVAHKLQSAVLPSEKRFMEAIIHKRFSAGIMNTAIYMASSAVGKGLGADTQAAVNATKSRIQPLRSLFQLSTMNAREADINFSSTETRRFSLILAVRERIG